MHLRQRRIHHEDQSNRDRNVRRADLKATDPFLDARDGSSDDDSHSHREEDPQRQVTVEKGKSPGDFVAHRFCSFLNAYFPDLDADVFQGAAVSNTVLNRNAPENPARSR